MNLYSFIHNDPIDFLDPFGLEPQNPFRGFDPDNLKKLFTDPNNIEKGKDLLNKFEDALKKALEQRNNPNRCISKDGLDRYINEMM